MMRRSDMHLALLGDSIFDNAPYTDGGPAVIDHLRRLLPVGGLADLLAVDGSTTAEIPRQLRGVGPSVTHLIISVGGNDALGWAGVLEAPARNVGEALAKLGVVVGQFETAYREMLKAVRARGLPVVLCTIYNCRFPEPVRQRAVEVALTSFNDVILRAAVEANLRVLELRQVCDAPEDYANPIEPSVVGGAKIAHAILRAVKEHRDGIRGAQVVS